MIEGVKVRLRDWVLDDLPAFEHWQKLGHKWQAFDGPYYRGASDESKELVKNLQTQIEAADFLSPRMRLVIASREENEILPGPAIRA